MQLKDKLPNMTEEEQLRLLATDGMLVKRPFVVDRIPGSRMEGKINLVQGGRI